MPRRHPRLPTRWLMTDERLGDGLWDAVRRLPPGSGIVFRHYRTPAAERRRLFQRLRRIARARGLVLVRAGATAMAGEMGVHARRGAGMVTWPVHDRREAARARAGGADLVFVSPLFATRSLPGEGGLTRHRAAALVGALPMPAIALGGMDARRFRALRVLGFVGYAGIDCWTQPARQKRKAVPT